MENVRGILSHGAEELESATIALSERYFVGDPQVLTAADFGVPQARERLFLVGVRRDMGIRPEPVRPTVSAGTTVGEAIQDLPIAPVDMESGAFGVPFTVQPESRFAKEMRGTRRAPDDLHGPMAWDESYCTNAAPTRHGKTVRARFERLSPGEVDAVSRVRRLDPHGVAVTIRAGTTPEYGSRSAPRPVHPFEDRVLTTRECARLQSFPDWYLFHPTRWHGNQQVGNAVPPLLARAVGIEVRRILGLHGVRPSSVPLQREHALIAQDFCGAPWLPDDKN